MLPLLLQLWLLEIGLHCIQSCTITISIGWCCSAKGIVVCLQVLGFKDMCYQVQRVLLLTRLFKDVYEIVTNPYRLNTLCLVRISEPEKKLEVMDTLYTKFMDYYLQH